MKATSRSQRPKRVGVSPKSDTKSGDEKRSGRVTGSASRAYSARKGRGSALGYSKVIPGTADASFCTAKGETSPVTEQPPLARGTKNDLDSGGVGIESPVTFGAVVNSDCPSALVKRMAGLRISGVQSDTSATVATVLPGEPYSNDAGEQNAARSMGLHEPSSAAVPRGLTFSPVSGGSSVEDGMVVSPAYDSGLKVEAEKEMSPSKYLEGKECSSSSPRELGQVLKVPASASFDLRQAAEGDNNVDVDCERSAIFDEMLQTVSVANNSTEKSVVLSLVEKEAMELAASFVVEVERTTVAVPRTVSINEDSSQAGLINKESKVGISKIASKANSTNQKAPQMGGAHQKAPHMGGGNQKAPQMEGANQKAPQMGGANQKAPQMGGANQKAPQMEGANQKAPQMGGANQKAPHMGGVNQKAPQKSFKAEVFEAGADSGGNVDGAQMRTKLAVGFPVTTGAAQTRKSGGNRRASFIPGSSATSRLGKPQRKSVGDVSRVPEVAPESTKRTEGPDGVVGTDVGATREFLPYSRAQRTQQTIKCGKSEGPRGASEEESIGQGGRRTVARRDQLSKGNSRRNSHNGNLRRGQSPKAHDGPAVKTAGRFGEKVVSKGLTVPEPFNLSTSTRTRTGSPSKTSKSRDDCLTFGERMVHMETKVPERFKRPAGEQPKPAASAPFHPEPTVPRSPNLRTEARAASNKKTPIGREEEDLAYMKKHQFKARRYSSDGFGISGEQGVLSKHHSDKPLTRQEPFRLSTGSRPTRNATSQDDCEIFKQFKARPLPGSRSSSVGRGRPGAQFNPGSPVLRSSKVGGENTKSSEQVELEESHQFKARPMPDYVKSRRQSVNPADKPVGLAEAEPSTLRTEERGKAKSVLLEHRRLAQRRQEEAVKKARARTRSSVLDLEHIHHERAAREFREKVGREEEETRLASKAKPFARASKPA